MTAIRAFFRRYGARLIILAYVAAVVRVMDPRTDLRLFAFLLGSFAALLGILSARAIMLFAVLSLFGSALTYRPSKIQIAENFVQAGYDLFLLLLGRQVIAALLDSMPKRRDRLYGIVRRLEDDNVRMWVLIAMDVRAFFAAVVRMVSHGWRGVIWMISRGSRGVIRMMSHGWRETRAVPGRVARLLLRVGSAADTGLTDLLRGGVWLEAKLPVSQFSLWLLFLFLIPFFWFRYGEGDFGGDSSRLYFLDPTTWLRTQALHEIGTDGFGNDNPTFFTVPFLLLLQGMKLLVLNRAGLVLPLFNGLLLMVAFLSVYGVLREFLLPHEPDGLRRRTVCFLGASFFVFSQIVMYQWQRYLYTFHQIAVYPVLVWLILRYLRQPKIVWILLGALWTFLFSVNFSAFSAPGFFAFFPFVGVLLLVAAVTRGAFRTLLHGAVFFLAIAVPLHAFHLVPQFVSLKNPQNALLRNLVTAEGKYQRGLAYFRSVRPKVQLLYNVVGFNQYTLFTETGVSPELLRLLSAYGVNFLPVFLLFPLVLLWGVLRVGHDPDKRFRALFLTTVLLLLCMLFLMTANVFGEWGGRLYELFFVLPGFSMFRSFYGIFSLSFVFLYSLAFTFSLRLILRGMRSRVRMVLLIGALLIPLLTGAVPFLTGRIVNTVMSDTKGLKLSNRFSPAFQDAVRWTRDLRLDAKFLTLPLTNYNYQVVDGEAGGAYVGASPLGIFAGKHVISGLGGFDGAGTQVFSFGNAFAIFRQTDVRVVRRLLATLNIGFIFLNTHPVVYEQGFVGWPYSGETNEIFPTMADVQELVRRLGYPRVFSAAHYEIYQAPADAFLPHFYIPQDVQDAQTLANVFGILLNNPEENLRLAVALRPDAGTAKLLSGPRDAGSSLEWKRVSLSEYVLTIHGLQSRTPVIFQELFHRGWRLFPRPIGSLGCRETREGDGMPAQPGHAERADIATLCARGLLSKTGPDFISQNFSDSIQNQNLLSEKPWKRWRANAIDERFHLRANDYANLWWLDVAYLQEHFSSALHKRPDGTYDLALVLEFTPERSFLVGAAVTSVVLIGTLAALGVAVLRARRERCG